MLKLTRLTRCKGSNIKTRRDSFCSLSYHETSSVSCVKSRMRLAVCHGGRAETSEMCGFSERETFSVYYLPAWIRCLYDYYAWFIMVNNPPSFLCTVCSALRSIYGLWCKHSSDAAFKMLGISGARRLCSEESALNTLWSRSFVRKYSYPSLRVRVTTMAVPFRCRVKWTCSKHRGEPNSHSNEAARLHTKSTYRRVRGAWLDFDVDFVWRRAASLLSVWTRHNPNPNALLRAVSWTLLFRKKGRLT